MAGPLPGLALTEMNKVDLFLPPERCQPSGADQQVHRELQGSSTPSDRVENRVLWSTEGGGKTGFPVTTTIQSWELEPLSAGKQHDKDWNARVSRHMLRAKQSYQMISSQASPNI